MISSLIGVLLIVTIVVLNLPKSVVDDVTRIIIVGELMCVVLFISYVHIIIIILPQLYASFSTLYMDNIMTVKY